MGGTGVQVEGLQRVTRALQKAGAEVGDLKSAFRKIGDKVTDDAQGNVDDLTGRLSASIRPSNAKNKAVIRAGGARIPYAGVIEYGGYNNIEAQSYMRDAVADNRDDSIRTLEEEIDALISRLGLNP